MRQSNVIFGVLVFAFVIYITLRGQLPAYIALFTGADTPDTGSNSGATSESPNKATDILNKDYGKAVQDLSKLYSNIGLT